MKKIQWLLAVLFVCAMNFANAQTTPASTDATKPAMSTETPASPAATKSAKHKGKHKKHKKHRKHKKG